MKAMTTEFDKTIECYTLCFPKIQLKLFLLIFSTTNLYKIDQNINEPNNVLNWPVLSVSYTNKRVVLKKH